MDIRQVAQDIKSGALKVSLEPTREPSVFTVSLPNGNRGYIIFVSGTEYSHEGQLRVPRKTRHCYDVNLVVDDLKEHIYSKVVLGESVEKEKAGRQVVSRWAKRVLGVDAPEFFGSYRTLSLMLREKE